MRRRRRSLIEGVKATRREREQKRRAEWLMLLKGDARRIKSGAEKTQTTID
jgi:hypothetical protein